MSINRFDYSNPKVMRWRAEVQAARRGDPSIHPYVIGRFVLDPSHRVVLAALEAVAWTVGTALTTDARKFYRWRTRQGAHQWHATHRGAGGGDLAVWFLDRLDVATGSVLTAGQPAGQLTAGQPDPSDDERFRAAEARALAAGDLSKVARLKAARQTIEKYQAPGMFARGPVDTPSTALARGPVDKPSTLLERRGEYPATVEEAAEVIGEYPATVEEAAEVIARKPDDVEFILKMPLTYRVCLRAAQRAGEGYPADSQYHKDVAAAQAILDAYHAQRVKR